MNIRIKKSFNGCYKYIIINPYENCEYSCKYCYYSDNREDLLEDNKIFIQNIKYLTKYICNEDIILIGSITDPYQPCEIKRKISRNLLKD